MKKCCVDGCENESLTGLFGISCGPHFSGVMAEHIRIENIIENMRKAAEGAEITICQSEKVSNPNFLGCPKSEKPR